MEQVLHRGQLQGREPVGVAVLWGGTRIVIELAKVRRFSEGDRRGFGKKILG